jgi:CRP-like cAMP-binding protein
MEIKRLQTIIDQHPFFEGLAPSYAELVAGCGRNAIFEPGAFILREGHSADYFYLIRHGNVAVNTYRSRSGPITLQTLQAGDILGGSWIVPPYQYNFDARAQSVVRAIAFDALCLRTKCEQDHELGYEMMRRFATIMTQRLYATRLQLLDVYGTGVGH